MKEKSEIWLVDDLPSNLNKFKLNHKNHYKIRTFKHPNQVKTQIAKGKHPDALLCDVFFYDTVKEAKRAEKIVDGLSKKLKRAATEAKANDHSRTLGIDLMEWIYEHFDRQRPPFPMYAYTSKGPFLLERKEWRKLSQFGAEILLKNRVSVDYEQYEIDGDVSVRKLNAKREFIGHGKSPAAVKNFSREEIETGLRGIQSRLGCRKAYAATAHPMLNKCGFAFLVLTADDSHEDQTRHARENVIHEAGLFQSRLGWHKAIILLEKGCEEFSNIRGLTQIRFPKGKIEKKFEEVRSVLKREGVIPR